MDLSGNAAVPGLQHRALSPGSCPGAGVRQADRNGRNARRVPPRPGELGEYSPPRSPPRRTAAGLLRSLPGLSSRHRRHVRAHRCRHENPRHGLARNVRPGSAEADDAFCTRRARLDGRRHLDTFRSRRQRPQRRTLERHRGWVGTHAGTRRHRIGRRSTGCHRSRNRSGTGRFRSR